MRRSEAQPNGVAPVKTWPLTVKILQASIPAAYRAAPTRPSVAEVTRTVAELGERGIILRALREGIDTATPTGRAVVASMATLAELEPFRG